MTRRTLLQTALARAGRQRSGIVDSHVHFYDPSRPQGIPWPPKADPLYRPVLPGPWAAMVGPLGVTGAVVVEASAWLEDNQWVLDLAQQHPVILGFIGHLEPGKPDFQTNLARFGRNPIFRGIRLNAAQLSAALRNGQALADLRALSDVGLTLDVIGDGPMLTDVAALAAQLPALRIVIDHLPFKAPGETLRALRVYPRVYAKVSGVVRTGHTGSYREQLDELWGVFGPQRLIYASNWPVCERIASYQTVLKVVQDYFSAKGSQAAAQFFSANSAAAYGWRPR